MQINATTVDEYLNKLPSERREAISRVREVVRQNVPEGYVEGLQYGMISYFIPLEDFPNTYNGQPLAIAAIGSQKNHMAVYLMGLYSEAAGEKWFREAWAQSGAKKLDMGKSCVRFRKLEDVALEVIGDAVKRISPQAFIQLHNAAHGDTLPKKVAAAKRADAAKSAAKKTAKKTSRKTARKSAKKKKK